MTWTIPRARKKVRKLRGRTRSMGWGRIGQHRKTGKKGGRGAAGMGKHKKSWMLKYAPDWFGTRGFRNPTSRGELNTIDLEGLERLVAGLTAKGQAKTEDGLVVVDLKAMGYEKLLGRGKLTSKVKVIVPMASEKAVQKVKEAGGLVVTEEAGESSEGQGGEENEGQ
ncbi:50S ribosomal protein L15P [Acidilobus saccharovorans 345-15]|uniref:Large ribosomal subunit protein uL15 n=1 Tax=Acidilobus saccharovorans (strain DSM 16705 / JCM 18335 / VKM B-2471 / 345-15) TaxID=666510 RepID=D9Q2U3_ACIS3|nr:uL15 family ribosomal protein [Acidilobus saccharovorans]ADL19631.1 50S ribosomal protein L15P [Acidilobus saccharovorans 345-15]